MISVPPPNGTPSETLARIEKELREIWSQPQQGGGAPLTRVCTMNLVVVAGSREISERYMPVVDEVTRSSLARAIAVTLDPDAETNELAGDTSAVCNIDGGDNVCTERIRLVATGNVCARVGSAVEALLVPEIPTALVWLGKVYVDDPVFESLAKVADRIITDSEYTSLGSVMQLARWSREGHGRPHIADLTWTRLAPWQELVARFFDEPRLAGHAMKVTKVGLRQAGPKGGRLGVEGALILGWLATRLGWKASRLGGALRFRRADGGAMSVEFGCVERPEGVAPATLGQIRLEAEVDGVLMRGSIERDLASGLSQDAPDADLVSWKLAVGDAPAVEQRVRFGTNKAAKWLERTLHRPPHDAALIESAQFAEDAIEDGIVCN